MEAGLPSLEFLPKSAPPEGSMSIRLFFASRNSKPPLLTVMESSPSQPSVAVGRVWLWIAWIGFGALALMPLVIDPAAQDDSFHTPKWAWLAIWTAVGCAGLIGATLNGQLIRIPVSPVFGLLIAWCAWHWIGIAWSPSPVLGWIRAAQVSWLCLAVWLGWNLLRGRRALLWLGWIWIGLGVANAVWILKQDIYQAWFPHLLDVRPNLPDWRGFISAGLGNTNHLGDLLVLSFIPCLVVFGEARRTLALWAAAVAAIILPAALIVCYSVGSNLGLISAAAVMIILIMIRDRGHWFRRHLRRWVVLVVGWLLLIGFFTTDHPLNPHRPGILKEGFGSERWHEGGNTRLAIWAETLEMIRLHPVLGVGPGNFTYVYPEMDSALIQDNPDLMLYQGLWTNAAHNELLQTWAELGIVGFFLFLALIAVAFHTLLHQLFWQDRSAFLVRLTLIGMLVAWVLHAQMNFPLQHPVGALSFAGLLLAVMIARKAELRERQASMPPLVIDWPGFVVRLDWIDMRRPTAIGLAGRLPRGLTIPAGIVLVLAAAVFGYQRLDPVRAQRQYHQAMIDMVADDYSQAKEHFKRALEYDPHSAAIRNKYLDLLLYLTGEPEAAHEQWEIVQATLNGNEQWIRLADILAALGRPEEAGEARRKFFENVWGARQGFFQRPNASGSGEPKR